MYNRSWDYYMEFESMDDIMDSDIIDYYVLGDIRSTGIFTEGCAIERHNSNLDNARDSGFNLVTDRNLSYTDDSNKVVCSFLFVLTRQGCLRLSNKYLHRELLKSVTRQLTDTIESTLKSRFNSSSYNKFSVSGLSTAATEFNSKNHEFNLVFNPRDWKYIKDLGNYNPSFNLDLIQNSYCDTGLYLLPDWNWRQGTILFAGKDAISIAGDTKVTVQRENQSTYELNYATDINLVDMDALSVVWV